MRFAFPVVLYALVPLIALILYKFLWVRAISYRYALTSFLKKEHRGYFVSPRLLLRIIRSCVLVGLLFLAARPQWVDSRSVVAINGVDIVLSIDVSGSMTYFDDLQDRRTRIEVAKEEALRFIEKRSNDPIGIVVFAADALSVCPLTLDKKLLKEFVGFINVNMIDANGTHIGTGLATAINRLRSSKSKSKVIVLLTDGKPAGDSKITPEMAADIAKECGIKIYAIGVGAADGGYMRSIFGIQKAVEEGVDKKLLENIATKTGGRAFLAHNPRELAQIYDIIDKLEKTEKTTNVFSRYYEAYMSFIWIVVGMLGLELLLRLFIWRGLLS